MLKAICETQAIKLVVFEQIAVYGAYPNTVAMEMVGVLKLVCEEMGIDYKAYPVKSIKMQTGNGNASKEQMVQFVQRYKPGVTSDDEADAIVLYQLAVYDLNLPEKSDWQKKQEGFPYSWVFKNKIITFITSIYYPWKTDNWPDFLLPPIFRW